MAWFPSRNRCAQARAGINCRVVDATARVGRWWIGLLVGVAACAPARPPMGAHARTAAAHKRSDVHRVVYCSATRTVRDVHHCLHELSPAQARRRGFVYRLDFDGKRPRAFTTVNGFGEPLPDNKGCARIEYKLDASGTRAQSLLCRNPSGVVRVRTRFLGRWAQWLDAWGHPRSERGVAGLIRTFDARGHVTGYQFADAKGRPTENADGVVEWRFRVNAAGETIQRSYYDANGKPVLSRDGYQRIDYDADGFGGWLAARYYDAAGKPATDRAGVHLVRVEEDDVGNVVGKSYWGLDDKPVVCADGYHAMKLRFDDHGEALEKDLFDVSGKLANGADGWAIEKRSYDKHGRPVEWTYFNPDGSPATTKDGFHRTTVELDKDGHWLVQQFFGVDGQLIDNGAYATQQTVYDARGNRISERFFGPHNEPAKDEEGAFQRTWRRNATGQVIAITTFDAKGALVDSQDGWARVAIAYAPDGTELRRDYFDKSGAHVDVGTYWMVSVDTGPGKGGSARASLQKVLGELGAGEDLQDAARAAGLDASRFTAARGNLIDAVKKLGEGATSPIIDHRGALMIVHREK